MELGMVGLGRMGGNMTQRLLEGGHSIVAYDPGAEAVEAVEALGARAGSSLEDLVSLLSPAMRNQFGGHAVKKT
jgi:6-phosphogluconate dehydrogenase